MSRSRAVPEPFINDWLPAIYREKIRTQRTRCYAFDVPARENAATIHYTLLGIELKVGKRRFACPDLATARYMRVFARLGCPEFAIPYDITKTSVIADELEIAWQRTLLVIDEETAISSSAARIRYRSKILKSIREEIGEIGAGSAMPNFDRETRRK